MATFPARKHVLEAAVRSLEHQVDEIHLALNEYTEIPGFLGGIRNLNPALQSENQRDVGKFVFSPNPDDHVFFVDDDLAYSPGYCDWITERAEEIGLERAVFGLHAGVYRNSHVNDAGVRKRLHYRRGILRSVFVDQLGTGTALALGKNVPSWDYMKGSQRFVDVRFAKWCFERGISQVAVARPFNMVRPLRHGGTTIYRDFTVNSPEHVVEEIRSYAGKSPYSRHRIGDKISLFDLLFGAWSHGR